MDIIKAKIDKVLRERNECEARRKEREQSRQDLINRYKELWTNNHRKLLNDEVDRDYLFELEDTLRAWMHDLHLFTMKFVDEKIVFNLHYEAFHMGQLLGLVEMKQKMKK